MLDILQFIKSHKVYKYIKENNGLIIFLFTVFGTLLTLIVRGISYLYFAGRVKAYNIPKVLLSDNISNISITVTVISLVLMILAIIFSWFTLTIYHKSKKAYKDNNKKNKLKFWVGIVIVFILFTTFISIFNYSFLTIQGVFVTSNTIVVFAIVLSLAELTYTNIIYENFVEGQNKVFNVIIATILIVLAMAIAVGSVYKVGYNSASSSKNMYQIINIDESEYVVIYQFDDKFIVAECEENENNLTINTDKQKIINFESVEYENIKFESIELKGNK